MPFDGTSIPESEELRKLNRVIKMVQDPDRWVKGFYFKDGHRRCLVGAMRTVGAEDLLFPIIVNSIKAVTGKSYWWPFHEIQRFNDKQSTTHAKVMEVLYHARRQLVAEHEREIIDALA